MSAKATPKKGKKKGGSLGLILVLFLMLICMLVVGPSTMVVIAGMVPTFVAFTTDRDPEKYAGICVGTLNLAGVLPYLIDLWKKGHTMEAAGGILSDPIAWMVMYSAAGIGWAIYFGIPSLVSNYITVQAESKIKRLQKAQEDLIKVWGSEITSDASIDDLSK